MTITVLKNLIRFFKEEVRYLLKNICTGGEKIKTRLFHDEKNNILININRIEKTTITYTKTATAMKNLVFEARFCYDCANEMSFVVEFFTHSGWEFLSADQIYQKREKILEELANKAIKKMLKKIATSQYSTTKDLVCIADKTVRKCLSKYSKYLE